jgi:hypothetical protein
MAGSFEKNSISWQIQLWQQRLSEWWERLFNPARQARLPNWSMPEALVQVLFWAIVAAFVAWAGWQLYRLLRPYLYPWLPSQPQPVLAADDTPAQSALTVAEWLQRSRTFAQQQNYREACRCLYLAVLRRLDDRQLIPATASRTDGEYLQLVRSFPNPQPYQVVIRTHERLCFSDTEISSAMFEQCQQAYQAIEQAEA